MKTQTTFINQVITDLSSHKNRNGAIATMVDEQNHELFANRIAMTFVALGNQRKQNRIEAVQQGVEPAEMAVKPEHLLSFVQNVMNSACWAARRVLRSGQQKDLANGLDFSQSVAEQTANLTSAKREEVETTLMDDFSVLNELHTWLCSEMNYMTDVDPLYLFAEKSEVAEGQWELTHSLMELDDVLTVLDDKAEQLAEDAENVKALHASTHVFGAKEAPKKKAKKAA